jgi:DNA-binding response OmpR family regulator
MRILLIDDEPHIRRMMRLTLEPAGYEVDEAADGQAGLDAFRDRGDYAAVILDQKMPGLTGLETLQRLRERTPEARVLMLTAFASIEPGRRCDATRCDRFPAQADDARDTTRGRRRRGR